MNQRAHHGFPQVIARFLLVSVLFGSAALSALFGVSVQAASAPNIISYQGRVLNTNGVPVASASATMVFEIYDSLAAGTCLWSNSSATCASATSRTVTLTDGLFSEPLGDTTVGVPYAAIADTVFGSNAGTYLQVTVNGETLTPRKQIVAAPYALNADTLDGLDSSAFTSLFTDGGTFTYLTSATDDLVIGGVTVPAASLFFDASVAELNLGTEGALNGLVRLYSSGAVVDATIGTNVSGDLVLTTPGIISVASNITSSADLALNGGDLTSTSAVFKLADAVGNSATIQIGGVSTDLLNTVNIATDSTSADFIVIGSINAASTAQLRGAITTLNGTSAINLNDATGAKITDVGGVDNDGGDTVRIATEGTSADVITIGNSNALTTLGLTGGDDWSVTTAGLITTANDVFINGGDLQSTSATFNFLDNTGDATTIDIGGVTTALSNTINIATNATGSDTINIGNNGAATSLVLTSQAWSITGPGLITTGDDLAVNGGDLTSTSATFNFLDAASSSTTIDIGGVTTSLSNTINIATNATGSDTINIGNNGAATSLVLTSQAWSITGPGLITTSDDVAIGGGDLTSTAGTFNFLDAAANSAAIDIGGVTTDIGNTIYIAINSTTADTLSFGNANASTVFYLDGGDDWAINATGDAQFENVLIDMTNTATTNGVCHSGVDSDTTATVREMVVCSAAPDDYAEWYETDGSAVAGDLVATTSTTFTYNAKQSNPFTGEILPGTISKTLPVLTKATSSSVDVFGIISTSPNQVIGSDVKNQGAHPQPIGLVGRVPLHVTSENGPIAAGDYLTVSSTPGYAMKATAPGRVIARALTNFNGVGVTTITAFIDNSWYGGEMLAADGSALALTGDLKLSSLAQATPSSQAINSHALLLTGSGWDGSSALDVTMGLRTKVNSLSNYRLAFENNLGGEIASITNSGDVLVSGKLYPSDRGLTQTNAYIFYDSSAGGGYMKTNAAGWNVGSYDFAEMFPSDDELTAGEVVVFADRSQAVKKSGSTTYDDKLVGVVSTRPGFLAGEYKAGSYPIALSGRVPTNVSDENGAVAIGDPLTTSSTPGVAMKATKAGPILGYAMEPLPGGTGKVVAFIRASYYSGNGTNSAPDVSNTVTGLSTAGSLDLSGSLNMNGGNILSVGSIGGIGGVWKIADNGDFTTGGALVKQVRSFMGDLVDTYPSTATERTVELSGTSTLQNGLATVTFSEEDPHFNQIISNTAAYRVLVTPAGATGQVFVTDRSNGGFIIHDTGSSTGVMVDWLVIAYEKDHEPQVVTPVVVPEPIPEPIVAGIVDPVPADPVVVVDTVPTEPIPVVDPVPIQAVIEVAPVETLIDPVPVPEPTLPTDPLLTP
ncbi:MAG: hypothetical protein WC813_04770 [Patescibacteria group bacterium]|jgi:hypothetical protein